jgi:hypothetical protein
MFKYSSQQLEIKSEITVEFFKITMGWTFEIPVASK